MTANSRITDHIGNTPAVALGRFCQSCGVRGTIYAKLEFFNPMSSIKDRVAYALIKAGMQADNIRPDTVIIEPTSGNTGIGLAMVCASYGLRLILTMPKNMSAERIKTLRALGADVRLTDPALGMQGAMDEARLLQEAFADSYMPGQFTNPVNPRIHYDTTGQEILRDIGVDFDYFVSGVGTGGTISGVGKALKEKNPSIKVIAVEPYESPVLSGGKPGAHIIQGIGAGFVPKTLDLNIIDEVIAVTGEQAREFTRLLAKTEGIFSGISSGAALSACAALLKRYPDKRIVTILPDGGDRYLSAEVY